MSSDSENSSNDVLNDQILSKKKITLRKRSKRENRRKRYSPFQKNYCDHDYFEKTRTINDNYLNLFCAFKELQELVKNFGKMSLSQDNIFDYDTESESSSECTEQEFLSENDEDELINKEIRKVFDNDSDNWDRDELFIDNDEIEDLPNGRVNIPKCHSDIYYFSDSDSGNETENNCGEIFIPMDQDDIGNERLSCDFLNNNYKSSKSDSERVPILIVPQDFDTKFQNAIPVKLATMNSNKSVVQLSNDIFLLSTLK